MTIGQAFRGGAAVVLAACGLGLMSSFGSLHLPSVLAYSGLVIFAAGIVTVFLPKAWSGFSHRISGPLLGLIAGGALFTAGWLWPARTVRIAAPASVLDAFMPAYDFHERHEITIHAPIERVRDALNRVSFADIGVMETLGRVRAAAMGNFRAPAPRGAPMSMPILQMMHDSRSGFFQLDDTPREVVFGLAGQPWRNRAIRLTADQFRTWSPPDSVKIAVNFLLEDLGGGQTRAVTETRVQATDGSARRTMAHYWTLIYPGTGMVRQSLLKAIRLRAEQP